MALRDCEGWGLSLTAQDYLDSAAWYLSSGLSTPAAQLYPFQPYGGVAMDNGNGTKSWMRYIQGSALSTFYWGGRIFLTRTGTGGWGFVFCDSTNANQVAVSISNTGVITALRGMALSGTLGYNSGTSIATSAAGAIPAATWVYLEVGAFIDATTGWMKVRVNGVEVINFSGNTKGSGSTATVNQWGIKAVNGNLAAFRCMDMYFDDNDFLGEVLVRPKLPTSGSSAAYTATGGSATWIGPNSGSSFQTQSSNTQSLTRVMSPGAGTLTSIGFYGSSNSAGAAYNMALYADVDGRPGALLATGNATTNWVSGALNSCTFTAGPTLEAGKIYWASLLTNTSILVSAGLVGGPSIAFTRTYGSGFLSNMIGQATFGYTLLRGGITISTAANFENASPRNSAAATGYNTSSNVGDVDKFNMANYDPTKEGTILGVMVKTAQKRTGAGSVNAATVLNSGGTDYFGTTTALPTTYQALQAVYPVDPFTGVAWTQAGLDAVLAGYKYVS